MTELAIPAINEEGRNLLIADLRTMWQHYDQGTFIGRMYNPANECLTVMCLAGLCLVREIGWEQYQLEAEHNNDGDFAERCVEAGARQLGLKRKPDGMYDIFRSAHCWPADLWRRYYKADSQQGRAEVAIEALMRLEPSGEIAALTV